MLIIPSAILPWSTYQSSLTARLKVIADDARLDVLSQRWESPDAFDTAVLHLNDKSILHREILMWAWDNPCWYARTIIPSPTYHIDTVLFNRLKKESLGDLIFNEKRIKRDYLKFYAIDKLAQEYQWLNPQIHQNAETLWVRLSQFSLDDYPFFLIEVLLPGLLRYSK